MTPFDITGDLYDSLARLGFDYIDLSVELSPEELAWLESGDPLGEGGRTSSA